MKTAEEKQFNGVGWVSVSDRMPPVEHIYASNRTPYIICRSDGVVQTTPAHTGFGFANIGGAAGVRVTHWMPLPEPPKC